jgi:hypothetical protein
MRIEKRRAASIPECRSRTTDRATTIPADPLRPWTSLSPTSAQMPGATAHATEAAQ